MVQGGTSRRQRVKRALLHSLHKVFCGLSSSDGRYRQEPASIKNLLKGDATWATRKFVLRWVLDTTTNTIQLPPPSYRATALHPCQHHTKSKADLDQEVAAGDRRAPVHGFGDSWRTRPLLLVTTGDLGFTHHNYSSMSIQGCSDDEMIFICLGTLSIGSSITGNK
jgi:hypothetical protein